MIIDIFAGKGGVGKTTCAVSLGYYSSQCLCRTLIIDYDGGHSVAGTLGIDKFTVNTINRFNDFLDFFIVENFEFQSIKDSKSLKIPFKDYLKQFKEDDGLLPFCDLAQEFFGVPTDIFLIQKFIILTKVLNKAKALGYQKVIIDVEPTAGLQRLLETANSLIRSLDNLSNKGVGFLTLLSVTSWSDVSSYLKGNYIKNVKTYTNKIGYTAKLFKDANYYLVCIPEQSPLKQTLVVQSIVEKFGGTIKGWIVNNVRSLEEKKIAQDFLPKTHPSVYLERYNEFHLEKGTTFFRLNSMSEIGKKIKIALIDK